MIAILSPAKTMDFDSPLPDPGKGRERFSAPQFLDEAATLADALRAMKTDTLATLMALKQPLADRTARQYARWSSDSHELRHGARPALFTYRGEVYRALEADTLSGEGVLRAQQNLRILSGLYGLLRPLDLVLPYRLEMSTPLKTVRGETLYQFWGEKLAEKLSRNNSVVVNLASQEYVRALPKGALTATLVTPVFREGTAGRSRVVGVYAKRQRGRMARYILDREIDDPEALKEYDLEGYRFAPRSSTPGEWVFLRSEG